MTPRGDPSPLPPGVLLPLREQPVRPQRETAARAPRRSRRTTVGATAPRAAGRERADAGRGAHRKGRPSPDASAAVPPASAESAAAPRVPSSEPLSPLVVEATDDAHVVEGEVVLEIPDEPVGNGGGAPAPAAETPDPPPPEAPDPPPVDLTTRPDEPEVVADAAVGTAVEDTVVGTAVEDTAVGTTVEDTAVGEAVEGDPPDATCDVGADVPDDDAESLDAATPAAVEVATDGPDTGAGPAAADVDIAAAPADSAEVAALVAAPVVVEPPTAAPTGTPGATRTTAPTAGPTGTPGATPTTPPAAEDDHERRHPWRTVARAAAWTTAIVAVAVVLLVFVFPTRTYVNQRHQLSIAATEVHVLDQQNSQLTAEVARLQTDTEIERLAREQYHLVRPGERAFAILPAPTPPTVAPPVAPVPKASGGWIHRLTGWIP